MIRTGLVGRSILASRSPWLHEQEARAQGIDLAYELFDFTARGLDDEDLGPLLRRIAGEGFAGVNVTFPFKQSVRPLLDDLAPCAGAVGAVNTVAMRDGRLIGYNTDKTGFEESVKLGLPGVRLQRVLQLGAGGAGAAVGSALLSLGTGELAIGDIDPARAAALATQLCEQFGSGRARTAGDLADEAEAADGIVNTTPMGMASTPGMAVPPGLIRPRHWVADIVYFPIETELLHVARSQGCRVLDGGGMAVNQAAAAFEIFTGLAADRNRMQRSFEEFAPH